MTSRSNRLARRLCVAGFLALGLVLTACATRADGDKVQKLAKEGYWGEPPQWAEHSKLLGQDAPELKFSNWIGKETSAEDMKGKIVVIDFWATWCGPCKAAIPHNNEVAKTYADKGVLVIGACGGGGEETMPDVATKYKIAYPTAQVANSSTDAWKIQWWPTYVVIDRKGKVRAYGIQPDYVNKVVDALLEEQPAAK